MHLETEQALQAELSKLRESQNKLYLEVLNKEGEAKKIDTEIISKREAGIESNSEILKAIIKTRDQLRQYFQLE